MTPIVEYPAALDFLWEPHRYKVAYGGRGGAKTWNFGRVLLTLGASNPMLIVCCRETMKSIADSSYRLLCNQIRALGLAEYYTIQQNTIFGPRGREGKRTEFIFAGLKHNIDNIKSLEGADVCWIDEAQSVSENSWSKLIPTVRKPGSEIWISFNPDLETDPTYRRFVLEKPPDSVVRKVTWRDNPWFHNTTMPIEMRHLQETNPAMCAHVWEGEPNSIVTGAIYAEEIAQAEREKRIGTISIDRTRPIDTFWDLGFGDSTAIWLAQALPTGQYRIVDYLSGKGKTIAEWMILLDQKRYLYGTDWLPHDAIDMIIHGKLAGDRTRSIEQLMRAAGRRVRIAPKMHVATGINAARTIFTQCWFDADRCADGLMSLRHYQWGEPGVDGVERREPLHNWASHGSDAFRTLAVSIKPDSDGLVDKWNPEPKPTRGGWMSTM